MQQFPSKCIRQIIPVKFEDDDGGIINNHNLRKYNNAPTTHSQLIRGKLRDIYRWKTSLSPTYLNNDDECERFINRWIMLWGRMNRILIKNQNKETLDNGKQETYETF